MATKTKTKASSSPYVDAYNKGKTMYEDNAKQQNENLKQSYQSQVTDINKNYDRTANQSYVQYRQNQKDLPEQLSRIGMTGGATESANLKLQTAYGANLADNEFNRSSDLAKAKTSYNDNVNAVNTTLKNTLASAYNSALQQDTAYTLEQEEIARQEAIAAREKAEAEEKAREIDKWNSDIHANIAHWQREGYEVYTWTDSDGKLHYRTLGKTTDAEAEAEEKAREIDKWNSDIHASIADWQRKGYEVYTWTDSDGKLHFRTLGKTYEESNTYSGGSSGGSSGDDESTGDDTASYSKTADAYKEAWNAHYNDKGTDGKNRYNVLATNLANAMLKDSSAKARAAQATILEKAYNNDELTNEQYKKLMKTLGYDV